MSKVFISYRRQDTADITGRIFDYLKARQGFHRLFRDVDSIGAGEDFRESLRDAVKNCDVLLAVIGDDWLNAKDRAGHRRIDDPDDYVHVEIATALARGIPVIPVLVENTSIPAAEELPEPLRPLVYRNAVPIRPDPHFHNDVDQLSRELSRILKRQSRTKIARILISPTSVVALIVVVGALLVASIFWMIHPVESQTKSLPVGNLYFLGIAINDYPKERAPGLRGAVNDVSRLQWVLQNYRPRGGKVQAEILVNSEANRERVLSELSRLRDRVNNDEGSTAIVAYSGYEWIDDGHYSLLLYTEDPGRLEKEALSIDDIFKTIPNSRGNFVFWLDTCHAGAIISELDRLNPTVTTFASCSSNELSIENQYGDDKVWGGAFTTALVEGLEGRADEQGRHGDGYVTLEELWPFVERRTQELTSGRQHPIMKGKLFPIVLTAPGRRESW